MRHALVLLACALAWPTLGGCSDNGAVASETSTTSVTGDAVGSASSPSERTTTEPEGRLGWVTHHSDTFELSVDHPADWERIEAHQFRGDPGFLHIDALAGPGFDLRRAAEILVNHRLRPYGSDPSFVETEAGGQAAMVIVPSEDAPPTYGLPTAVLVVEYPSAVQVGSDVYRFAILAVSEPHVFEVASSLRFDEIPQSPGQDRTPTQTGPHRAGPSGSFGVSARGNA